MTTLQLAIAAGGLVGLGLTLVLWRLVPAQPHLGSALERLAPDRGAARSTPVGAALDSRDRLGLWVQRRLPIVSSLQVPTRELSVLRIPVHRFYGEKALYALIGLLFPPVLTAVLTLFADPEAEVVAWTAMEEGIRLGRFYLGEARRLAAEAEVSTETAEAERMRRWLVESWPEDFISERLAMQCGPGPLLDNAKIKRAFVRLETDSWIFSAGGGATTKQSWRAWRVVRPKL